MAITVTEIRNQLKLIGIYTWAQLTALTGAPAYSEAIVSDYNNIRVMYDGTRWVPVGPQVLARSAVAIATPADLTEDVLATLAVPAGVMGINGALCLTCHWTFTSSANNKTPRVRFSGPAGTVISTSTFTTGTAMTFTTTVTNRGAANSQYAESRTVNGVANVQGTSQDTAAASSLVITGQKALAGETLQLEAYVLELLP
jgi:hypothetical protein